MRQIAWDVAEAHKQWGWYLALGVLLILVGAYAIYAEGLSTLASVLALGIALLQHPGVGALTITLLLGALFMFGGIFRFVSALWLQFPNYGWVAGAGVLSFILGLLLWIQWPTSAFWFIGFAVGLNFIFAGIAWSSLALRLKAV